MSQKPTEPANNHGLPADNRARSGGLDGIPESTCASACRLNRKEQVPYIPIPGRPDSRMQDGEVGPGLGAGKGEQPELGPPETNPQARLPGRAQGPRGSCGQWNDIGPGAPQSGLVTPPHPRPVHGRYILRSHLLRKSKQAKPKRRLILSIYQII